MAKRLAITRWRVLREPGPGAQAIGHLRVSTGMQANRGLSIPEQKRLIQELCDQKGWIVVEWVEEPGVSAKDDFDSRPIWKRLIFEQAGRDCQAVICHELSRWSRDSAYGDLSLRELRRKNCWWQTVAGGETINDDVQPGQDVWMSIKRTQGAGLVRDLSGHVHKGKESKARQGLSNGRPPYGYRYPNGVIYVPGSPKNHIVYEPDPETFPVLQLIGRLAAQSPALSAGAIVDHLNLHGHRFIRLHGGMRSVSFTRQIVCGILRKPYYRAYGPSSDRGTVMTPEGESVEGRHQAAWDYVTCARIEQSRTLFRTYAPDSRTAGRARKFLYSGILRCAYCGGSMVASGGYSRQRERVRTRYICSTLHDHGECSSRRDALRGMTFATAVREEDVDQQIIDLFEQMEPLIVQAESRVRERASTLDQEEERVVEEANKEIRRHEDRKPRHRQLFLAGDITFEEYKKAVAKEDTAIRAAQARIPTTNREQELASLQMARTIIDIWERTKALSPEQRDSIRREALVPLIEVIQYDPIRQVITAIRPNRDFLTPLSYMLPDWTIKDTSLVLNEPPIEADKPLAIQRVYNLLAGGVETIQDILAHTDLTEHQVRRTLRLAVRYQLVGREKIIKKPQGGYYYRYLLCSTFDAWLERAWFKYPMRHES